MKKIDAKALLDKYKHGNCTDEELALLHTWYLLDEPLNTENISIEEVEIAKNKIWQNLPAHKTELNKQQKTSAFSLYKKYLAAAVILICASIGFYFLNSNNSSLSKVQTTAKNDIAPGKNEAILTLENGEQIVLNNISNGVVETTKNGINIVKTEQGKIAYQATGNNNSPAQINTLNVPAGGFYSLTLSDGSIVWLNAKSSLKFPTNFTATERIVELTGEGYFEVAHKANQPFKVKTNNQTVEVLGTHFNINAYNDELSTTTTLLEGSVKVSANGASKILSPNYQAKLVNGKLATKQVNTASVVDWVSNDFVFDNDNMASIMRKISRWYNVEVNCPADLENLEFTGSISRTKNLSQVLKIMELTGIVKFKIEGRRITVM